MRIQPPFDQMVVPYHPVSDAGTKLCALCLTQLASEPEPSGRHTIALVLATGCCSVVPKEVGASEVELRGHTAS